MQSAPWFDAQDIIEERTTEPAPERNRPTLVPTGEEPEQPQPLADLIETASAEARLQRISLIERCLTERFADGDFDGALQAAQQILSQVPSHEGAQSYAKSCQRLIERRHLARIGGLSVVPYLAVSKEQLPFLALDHREGFLVSLVDGATPIGELIDISGLNPLDVLKTIAGLLDAEVLQLR